MLVKKINQFLSVVLIFFLSTIIADNGYVNPLIDAVLDGNTDRVALNLDLGKEAGLTRDIINQALLAAAKNGYSDIVEKLLEAGAIPNVLDENGMSALMMAAQEGHLNVLQTLLQHKAETELANKDGETVLLIAVRNGNFDMVNELIQAGANVNHTSAAGVTSLIIAAKKGYEAILKLLCKEGATIPGANVMTALPDSAQELLKRHCSWTDYLKSQWGAWTSFIGSPFASPPQQEDSSYEPIFEEESSTSEIVSNLAVLQLEPLERDPQVIKNAYKTLALKYHPDKGGDQEQFKEINNAYHALKKHLNF